MRIRQVKPSFWSDPHIAELTEPARLFYIGLWGLADDAGWLCRDVPEIAHELYGYDGRAARERRVVRLLSELASHGRIAVHPCGHVQVPTLVRHQHLPGPDKRVESVYRAHLRGCAPSPQSPADPRRSPQSPADPRPVKGNGNGKVKGDVKGRDADATTTREGGLAERIGPFEAIVAGKPS